MKLALLGTGMIVQKLLSFVDELPIEELSILSTKRSQAAAYELAEQYNIKHCYTDYDRLLASDADVVYIGLPNHLHYTFAKKAVLTGKHVLIEKPVTANYDELSDLKIAAATQGVFVLEVVNVHHLPAYKSLKEDVTKIGQLRIATLNLSQYSSRYRGFQAGDTPPVFDCHKAGGALMDINHYNLHAAVGLFGKPGAVQYMANLERGIDTSGVLVLDYGSFKVICIGAKDCQAPVTCTFQGDKGSILIPSPMNHMDGYTVIRKEGRKDLGETEVTFDAEASRPIHIYAELLRIIKENDRSAAQRLMNVSCMVSQIEQEARKQAGIIFEKDQTR